MKEYIQRWSQELKKESHQEKGKGFQFLNEDLEGRGDAGNRPQEYEIENFIEGMGQEIENEINESEGGQDIDIERMKAQAYELVSKIKNREDLERFLKDNQGKYNEFQNNKNISGKIKRYLKIIWDILSNIVKFGLFCSRNITSLGILAVLIMTCIKFNVGPIEALEKGFKVAKVIYQAADMSLNGAKKGVEIYQDVQDASEGVGEKVGNIIGKMLYRWI